MFDDYVRYVFYFFKDDKKNINIESMINVFLNKRRVREQECSFKFELLIVNIEFLDFDSIYHERTSKNNKRTYVCSFVFQY